MHNCLTQISTIYDEINEAVNSQINKQRSNIEKNNEEDILVLPVDNLAPVSETVKGMVFNVLNEKNKILRCVCFNTDTEQTKHRSFYIDIVNKMLESQVNDKAARLDIISGNRQDIGLLFDDDALVYNSKKIDSSNINIMLLREFLPETPNKFARELSDANFYKLYDNNNIDTNTAPRVLRTLKGLKISKVGKKTIFLFPNNLQANNNDMFKYNELLNSIDKLINVLDQDDNYRLHKKDINKGTPTQQIITAINHLSSTINHLSDHLSSAIDDLPDKIADILKKELNTERQIFISAFKEEQQEERRMFKEELRQIIEEIKKK